MSSNGEQIAAGQNGTPETLRDSVEELAVKLVLGELNNQQSIALLECIRGEAQAARRDDVAQIASEAINALSNVANGSGSGSLFPDILSRLQQALAQCAVPPSSSVVAVQSPVLSASAPPVLPLGEDRELIGDFILEAREHLAQVEVQMMTVEKGPENAEAINTVFRGFHTIKGLAGFLGLEDMGEVAHETETLLNLARNQKLKITPPVVDIVLAAADFLKYWLVRLEATLEGRDAGPAPEKLALLERVRHGALGAPEAAISAPDNRGQTAVAKTDVAERREGSSTEWIGPERRNGDGDRRAQCRETRTVKVDTAKLDLLVDLAGEMVIAQSMLRWHPELAAIRSPAVLQSLAQLTRITGDLQKNAMSMRMVPIGGLFQKMSRLVRDLARKTGKQLELEVVGGDTELDRNVVEELADPLMHMIRNAADHGIEPAEERLASGKDLTGRIRLRASHQAGYIVIEVADDGRGLVREKIVEKACRMGLLEDGANLSESEVFDLIFLPGFSTASTITDVSGRGVGMDVVKKQIQKLRGHVTIESSAGEGTSFFLRLPLTLAMIDGLVVGVGAERYVLPIFSVREMLRPSAEMVFTMEERQEMALVRNSIMPVVRLYKRFGVKPSSELPTESLLIVAEAGTTSFCLMVDELIGKQEVVIKSLGESLKDTPGVAGGAILGDGRVGLILDLEGVFRGGMK